MEIGLIFDHAKANMSELAHGPAEGRHFAFAALEQALIVCAHHRVIAHGRHRGHVEFGAQVARADFAQLGPLVDRLPGTMFRPNLPKSRFI